MLLYDFAQDKEAPQGDYEQFWSTYDVRVSVADQGAPISLTGLAAAADGYRQYVTVTVTDPWSGSIDVKFAPKQGTDTGSGTGGRASGWVSIRQAQN